MDIHGNLVAKEVVNHIRSGDKISAIKALRELKCTIYNCGDDCEAGVSLLDAKTFVEGLKEFVEITTDLENEVVKYRKLREAGFCPSETIRIIEALS